MGRQDEYGPYGHIAVNYFIVIVYRVYDCRDKQNHHGVLKIDIEFRKSLEVADVC
jgi:hypothetical protein